MHCEDHLTPTRRKALGMAGAFFAWPFLPRYATAAGGRDPRFITVVLRGAMDGLSAIPPVGDPDYLRLRENIAVGVAGSPAALPLDGIFAAHPAMPNFARLYQAKQALAVHAVATGYRERSHFDGQDVLESGQPGPGLTQSGWLNRALSALPQGEKLGNRPILGVGSTAPLIVRGAAPITGWAPQVLPRAGDDLASRLLDLYRHTDPSLAEALAKGLDTDRIATANAMDSSRSADATGMQTIAEGAARLMRDEAGPRIAAVAFEGWDTHANQGGATGQLATRLAALDGAIAAFERGLGPVWKDTVISIVTEFGRTAHVNGTTGSDHGTGTALLLVGGAVRGGRVVADWPGLKAPQLHQGRDLKPTTDVRAVLKGVMIDHLGLSAAVLAETIFPQTGHINPLRDLVA